VGFGAVAGVIAPVTLVVMHWLQDLVWGVGDARWHIPVAILVGGALVAVLRRLSEGADLDREVGLTADPVHLHAAGSPSSRSEPSWRSPSAARSGPRRG
jgi:hypothetical protein